MYPESALAATPDVDRMDTSLDDDEGYGRVIKRPIKSRLKELRIEGHQRGVSFDPSSSSFALVGAREDAEAGDRGGR